MKPIHFEHSITELEGIVQALEKGDLSLEESLSYFEKGINLAKRCQETLKTAEQTIERLSATTSTDTDTNTDVETL